MADDDAKPGVTDRSLTVDNWHIEGTASWVPIPLSLPPSARDAYIREQFPDLDAARWASLARDAEISAAWQADDCRDIALWVWTGPVQPGSVTAHLTLKTFDEPVTIAEYGTETYEVFADARPRVQREFDTASGPATLRDALLVSAENPEPSETLALLEVLWFGDDGKLLELVVVTDDADAASAISPELVKLAVGVHGFA